MKKSNSQTRGQQKQTPQKGQELNYDQFKIYSILLYNPEFLPKGIRKPESEDFQDAKLLFYYPSNLIDLNKRRNHVGLSEGSFKYIESQQGEKQLNDVQIIKTHRYIHISKQIEPGYWLVIVLKIQDKTKYYPLYGKQNKKDLAYIDEEALQWEYDELPDSLLINFIDHFNTQFNLFYGKFADRIVEERLPKEGEQFLIEFIESYKRLTSYNGIFTANRFQYKYLLYAPIEKKQFMALQYLMNMVKVIDKQIKHQILFYNGFFIYSTLPHHVSQTFYDYFYVGKTYFNPYIEKIKNSFGFTKLIGTDEIYGKINLLQDQNNGYLYGWQKQLKENTKQPQQTQGSKQKQNSVQEFDYVEDKFPTLRLDDSMQEYKVAAFAKNGILLLQFYNKGFQIEPKLFKQTQLTLEKNLSLLTGFIKKDLELLKNQQQKTHQIIYFNKENLAFKCLPKNLIQTLDKSTKKLLQAMMSQLEADDDLVSITSKSIQYWVMGFQENERTVFALFPGNYTLYKVEVQMNWLTQRFFSGIFI